MGKWILTIVCTFLIVVTLISAITYKKSDIDSGILTVGVTAVLVVITVWYAISTEKNVKIIERGSQGKYIAELSRSIFSPMLNDLCQARKDLVDGSFLLGIKTPATTLDRIHSPDFFLKEKILIRSTRTNTAQQPIDRGVVRPAPSLLKNPDDVLKKHYPEIDTLTRKYCYTSSELKKSIQQISTDLPAIWGYFKLTCDSRDTRNLKDYFTGKSIENPHESNYCLILRILISNREHIGNTQDNYCLALSNIQTQEDNFLKSIQKDRHQFYYLAEFIVNNKENLNHWLSESKIKDDISQFQKTRMDLIKTIDQLSEKIEELLLDWKVEYYLTEDEMHLDEEYWGNSEIL